MQQTKPAVISIGLEEIHYRLYVRQMVEEGREDVRQGNVVSQDEIERDLDRWLEQ